MAECCAQEAIGARPGRNRAHRQDADNYFCRESPDGSAVKASVNLCLDRQLNADVQDVAGTRLNPNALPDDDPELLATPVAKKSNRAPPATTSSWQPKPAQTGFLDTASQFRASDAFLPVPRLTITNRIEDSDSNPSDSPAPSLMQQQLARARARAQHEERRRRTREEQNSFHQQCSRLHMSDLNCRLRLRRQKLSALSDPVGRAPETPRNSNH